MTTTCSFKDRVDAGRHLAEGLKEFRGSEAVVLGLARGGVVVAAQVARELDLPLDVLVVRKIGAPRQPEYGIGAVAPGVRVVDDRAVHYMGLSSEQLEELAENEEAEIERRLYLYRGGSHELNLNGRFAILVDDGLATGITAVAAVRYAKAHGAESVILAAPVCSEGGMSLLKQEADRVVCSCLPPQFMSVGQWYENFTQTSDEEVIGILSGRDSEGRL
jgi:putative phosphoribosyl transferase